MKHYKDYIKENKLKNKTFEELSEEEIERFNKYRDMSLIIILVKINYSESSLKNMKNINSLLKDF